MEITFCYFDSHFSDCLVVVLWVSIFYCNGNNDKNIFLRSRLLAPKYTHFDSSSSLFQSQQSLKSQLNRKKSMLTIIFTGNREEAK